MSETSGFTHVEPLREIRNEAGEVLFNDGQNYPIEATYQRGNHMVDSNALYFDQTTLVVVSNLGQKAYVPYMSGNFSKKRLAVQQSAEASEVVSI